MTALQEKPAKAGAKKLEGKLAVVTGGSRGIGTAIALRLAADGAQVVITYNKNSDAAAKVVAQINNLDGKALAVRANAASPEDNEALIAQIKHLGKIDILVNNAGVFEGGPIGTVGLDQFDRLFGTNVKGVVATTSAVLPQMNNGGRIINISSVAAKASMAGFSLYSATKAALDALTRIWAQELGQRQITVNGVAPGVTVTDMMEAGMDEAAQKLYASRTALGRLGQPSDIADTVAFLASDDGRWITGQTVIVDGGIAM
jgi:3-oxoacyl-[acyl-carrier protein] reductase